MSDLTTFNPMARVKELEARESRLKLALMHKDNLLAAAETVIRANKPALRSFAGRKACSDWITEYERMNR